VFHAELRRGTTGLEQECIAELHMAANDREYCCEGGFYGRVGDAAAGLVIDRSTTTATVALTATMSAIAPITA